MVSIQWSFVVGEQEELLFGDQILGQTLVRNPVLFEKDNSVKQRLVDGGPKILVICIWKCPGPYWVSNRRSLYA